MRHTPGFNTNNDNAGLTLKLLLGNINWLQAAYYNTDSGMRLNSYLYTTELSLANSRKLNMLVNGGIGLVENMLQSNVHGHDRTGYYLGYKGSYKDGNWNLNSCATYYDEKFPGYNQGSKNTLQSIRYSGKKAGVEAYYQYDVRQSNFFVDTVYNTDILTYNVQKYGLRFYVHSRQSSVAIGGGVIRQVGLSSYSFAPDYTFGELQYNYISRKGLSVSLSSLTGYAAVSGVPGFLVSAYGTVAYRAVGISGGYSRIPVIISEAGSQRIAQNVETIYGGPYIGFSMFRHLAVSTQYSVSKTLYGDGLNSFANINLTYENPHIGTRISVTASAPLQRPDARSLDPVKYGYLNISLRQDLGIPFILKRKYYNLKARFFRDENGNGVMDDGEAALSKLPVQIGDKHLITDRFGFVHYKNIRKGNYDLDLSNSPVKGYIPGDGYLQPVSVVHNKQVDIPFRLGKVVSGRIKILQDSAYEGTFSPGNLKVTGRDSAGHEYSAMTNNEGDYFISLPAGRYNISLNPAAFNDFYKPLYFSRDVDISTAESATVDFDVKQRRRGVKMLQVNGEIKAAATKNLQKVGYVPATIAEKDSLLKVELKNKRHHHGNAVQKTSKILVDKKTIPPATETVLTTKPLSSAEKEVQYGTKHAGKNMQQAVIERTKKPAGNAISPKSVKHRLPAKKRQPVQPNPPRLICQEEYTQLYAS